MSLQALFSQVWCFRRRQNNVVHQGDQKIGKKLTKFWKNSPKQSPSPKMPKYLHKKSIWESKNINVKPFLKPLSTCNKPYFEIDTAYLGENVLNLPKQKVAQNVSISLRYLIFSKGHNWLPKIAQLVKNCPSGYNVCHIISGNNKEV